MDISVIGPIGKAFSRTGTILFRPFAVGKWFVLGFCAWLAFLGQGGGMGPGYSGRSSLGRHGRFGPPAEEFEQLGTEVTDWVQAHLAFVIVAAVAIFLTVLAVGLVITWLQSRGKFMFLDGVVRNRGAVVEPWHQFRQLGNSLFWFHVVLWLISGAISLMILAAALAIAWPDIRAGQFGGAAIAAILVWAAIEIPLTLAAVVIFLFLEDFVVPAMYLRNVRTMAAWGIVGREVLKGHLGVIILYCLMRIVLGLAIGICTVLGTCLTCCLAALPYLGTVILLPLPVFRRCYSLYFLEQFGDPWRAFPSAPAAQNPGQ
jgi:hypothetical protein